MWPILIHAGLRFMFCLRGFDISVNMAEQWRSDLRGRGLQAALINPEVA